MLFRSAAQVQAARARAFLLAIDAGTPPRLVLPSGLEPHPEAHRLLEGQFAEFQTKVARLDAELTRREAELQSVQESLKKVERTLPITRQRAKDFKDLLDKNFVSKHLYMER